MKERLKNAVKRTAQNPVLRKSAESIKPNRSIWGVLGVVFFFILPEIVGFVWGAEITAWAHQRNLIDPTETGKKLYWLIGKLFEDGGSWVNLTIGVLLLVWLFWDWKKSKASE
ncbi:hypothetical protein [Sulfurovum sp.]|uniref:hypothetical protein n=1 Tax=Sulfurovum sp. TaxID=1969726 RepID=UPI0025CFF175|nr:hypothetical protein [Sulfurovum sp.]